MDTVRTPCQEKIDRLIAAMTVTDPDERQRILEAMLPDTRVEVEARLPVIEMPHTNGHAMPTVNERVARLIEEQAALEIACLNEIAAIQAAEGIELAINIKAPTKEAQAKLEAALKAFNCRLIPSFRAKWQG